MAEWMTPEIVGQRIDVIRAAAGIGDDEVAHCCEDGLYEDLLRAIAEGRCVDPQECACAALESQDIKFGRWCA